MTDDRRHYILQLENTHLNGPVLNVYDLDRLTDLFPGGYDDSYLDGWNWSEDEPLDPIPLVLLQALVGGYIEHLNSNYWPYFLGSQVALWVNEEGKLKDLPKTLPVYAFDGSGPLDYIVGSIVFTGLDESVTTALTRTEVEVLIEQARLFYRSRWSAFARVLREDWNPRTSLYLHGDQVTQ